MKKKMFVGGFIVGAVMGLVGGYFICKKTTPEVDVEATEEMYDRRAKKYKEKLKASEEKVEELKESLEMLRQMRKADLLNMKDIEEETKRTVNLFPEGYPMTEADITSYNIANNIHGDKTFITEEEYESDEEDVDKVEVTFHNDGTITNDDTGAFMDIMQEVGNLVAGMGPECPVRYIRNTDIDVDYKVTYQDAPSRTPLCR